MQLSVWRGGLFEGLNDFLSLSIVYGGWGKDAGARMLPCSSWAINY
ncbi:hypothetical protein KDH_71020 [Dictyobacter sp. S3.2.2.5]|uniref:Uncharacterized protein n=1 Tax=Dictyobacter halimunensis TaxID=3026934 RepID=A0ABQ6G648_9CHLR|nr:hypothetical protein KDH_71020 [Dictyobacter sp. S3.2.2.5]